MYTRCGYIARETLTFLSRMQASDLAAPDKESVGGRGRVTGANLDRCLGDFIASRGRYGMELAE